MRKAERLLNKLARRYNRRVITRNSSHMALVCKRGERPTVWCASTPKNVDHWLLNVERDCQSNDQPIGDLT